MTPTLQPDHVIVQSLLALKRELETQYLGTNGPGAEIAMKINSCLYDRYPINGK